MAEFAIILPVLMLLLVLAIDVGRVFFGWVALHNAARIGANYAGQNPDGWDPGDPDKQADYEQLVTDAVAGCEPQEVDPPEFTDVDGDGDAYGWGDQATVTLTCDFETLVPLADALVGDPMEISAEAVFPVRTGTFAGPAGGGGGGGGPEPCTLATVPYLVGRTLDDAKNEWYVEAGFDPATLVAFPDVATYIVTTQSLAYGTCVDASTTITVNTEQPDVCAAGEAQVPSLLTELVADAKTIWAADFSGAFKPNNAVDTDVVLTQETDPVGDIGECITVSASVTITWGDPPEKACDVPNMVGQSESAARALWTEAEFTTTLKRTGNGPQVRNQDPGHPGRVSCDVAGTIQLGR